MRADLELKLQNDFPFMKLNRIDRETNTYRRYGCECSDGWYNLIHDMCQSITDRYAAEGKAVDLIPMQIKEKFAALRFYYSFGDAPCNIFALDSLTGTSIRFTPENNTLDEASKRLRKDIAKIVYDYEEKSRTVCELCGDVHYANIRMDLVWKRTLCNTCYEKYIKAVESRKEKRNALDKTVFLD